MLILTLALVLVACRPQSKSETVILSYSESNTNCVGCPRFRVDFSSGGHVNFECLGSCAVPSEQHHLVPAERFQELVQAFHDSRFFTIPRTDSSRMVADATVFRLTYRDNLKIHEVVDIERHIPQILDLEKRIKAATEVDRYLKPSAAMYQSLVKAGWDVNSLGPDHQNALYSAVIFRDLESIRFLLQHGSKVTDQTLDFAVLSGNLDILRRVISGSEVKLSGELGASMLGQATRSGRTDLLEFLLNSGANVNAHRKQGGGTALLNAVSSGSLENVRFLLSKGADVTARDENGRTALWYAAVSDNTGFITLLVQHGADVNERDNQGKTPLMHAFDLCYTWTIRALLDAGAYPFVQEQQTNRNVQLYSTGDPKCAIARSMIEEAVHSRPANQ